MAHPLPTLTTARLTLDAITFADADDCFRIFSDPAVTRYLDIDTFVDLEQSTGLLDLFARRLREGTELRWAIRRAGQRRLIGTISLYEPHSSRRRSELGYVLAGDVWRQGLATEAIGAVLAHAFGPLNLNRVEALVYADNTASRRLLESLGFTLEGLLREHAWEKGRFWDDTMYSLLAREYAERDAGIREQGMNEHNAPEYTDEPIEFGERVEDFLPAPEALRFRPPASRTIQTQPLLVVEFTAHTLLVQSAGDAADLIGQASADAIVLHTRQVAPAFFDLSTRLLGDFLQTFVNYHVRLAIVGDFEPYPSKALKDLMRESNRQGDQLFVATVDAALARWRA